MSGNLFAKFIIFNSFASPPISTPGQSIHTHTHRERLPSWLAAVRRAFGRGFFYFGMDAGAGKQNKLILRSSSVAHTHIRRAYVLTRYKQQMFLLSATVSVHGVISFMSFDGHSRVGGENEKENGKQAAGFYRLYLCVWLFCTAFSHSINSGVRFNCLSTLKETLCTNTPHVTNAPNITICCFNFLQVVEI